MKMMMNRKILLVLFNHYRIHKREQYLEISTSSNLRQYPIQLLRVLQNLN